MIKLDIMKGMFLAVLHCFFKSTLATEALCVKRYKCLIHLLKYAVCDHSLKDSYLLDTTKSLASTVKQLLLTHL